MHLYQLILVFVPISEFEFGVSECMAENIEVVYKCVSFL